MEEICTIIPLHVLMDMPKEVIFELFGKEKVRPTISVGQRFFVVEEASCEYTGTQEPRGLKAPFWEIKCDTTIIHMKLRIRKATGKKKSQGGQNALNKLNSFLNAASAEPAYILHSTWTNQQNAITYKEIREAIMNGHMSESTFQQWQQDYSKMVSARLSPVWVKAICHWLNI